MAAPRQLVNPPTFTPLPYGLLTVVENPSTADGYWQHGVTYQTQCTSTLGNTTYDECIAVTGVGGTAPSPPLAATVALQTRGATPFTAYVEFDCSAVGNDQAQQRAEQAMAQGGSWQVERAFWTGTAGGQPVVWPHLSADASKTAVDGATLQSVPVTGGSATMDVAEALGFLEKQLANCANGVGVIHVPTEALPTLDAWGLVKQNGVTLKTLNGNKVVVGSGYPGTSPAGAAPAAGTTWMYATGPIFAYVGETRITDRVSSFDKAENTIKMIAQRTYVLGWDCCHAGVLVRLGVPWSGSENGV